MIKMHDFKTGSQRSSYPSPDPEISSAPTHTTNQKKCSKCFCFFFVVVVGCKDTNIACSLKFSLIVMFKYWNGKSVKVIKVQWSCTE